MHENLDTYVCKVTESTNSIHIQHFISFFSCIKSFGVVTKAKLTVSAGRTLEGFESACEGLNVKWRRTSSHVSMQTGA